MTIPGSYTSQRAAALTAGFGLAAMTIFAVAAIYFIFPKLIVPGDASLTVINIIADKLFFRIGIGCLIIVAILDIIVAWALYIFFEPINRSISLLAAWFRLIYAAILASALFNYAIILNLLSGADFLKAMGADQLQAEVVLSLKAFDDSWAIGLVFFGLHLVFLGYVILQSVNIPKLLGLILIAAGLAYFIDNMAIFLLPNYSLGLATFVGWGELLLMFWLLFKGLRVQRIQSK